MVGEIGGAGSILPGAQVGSGLCSSQVELDSGFTGNNIRGDNVAVQ